MNIAKKQVYAVTYKDDTGRKHITFVKGLSEVRFLEDRFEKIQYETAEKFAVVYDTYR